MESKTFTVVTSISMALALTVAVLSIIGIPITGVYPGMLVLLLLTLIPIASRFYAKKIMGNLTGHRRNIFLCPVFISTQFTVNQIDILNEYVLSGGSKFASIKNGFFGIN